MMDPPVPKKVNRHVMKALVLLCGDNISRGVTVARIVQQVQHQMRNLVPVPHLPAVVERSLEDLTLIGLIVRNDENSYSIGRSYGMPASLTRARMRDKNDDYANDPMAPKRKRKKIAENHEDDLGNPLKENVIGQCEENAMTTGDTMELEPEVDGKPVQDQCEDNVKAMDDCLELEPEIYDEKPVDHEEVAQSCTNDQMKHLDQSSDQLDQLDPATSSIESGFIPLLKSMEITDVKDDTLEVKPKVGEEPLDKQEVVQWSTNDEVKNLDQSSDQLDQLDQASSSIESGFIPLLENMEITEVLDETLEVKPEIDDNAVQNQEVVQLSTNDQSPQDADDMDESYEMLENYVMDMLMVMVEDELLDFKYLDYDIDDIEDYIYSQTETEEETETDCDSDTDDAETDDSEDESDEIDKENPSF